MSSGNNNREVVTTFLQVAARYKSSPQILSAVADFLDSMDRYVFIKIMVKVFESSVLFIFCSTEKRNKVILLTFF